MDFGLVFWGRGVGELKGRRHMLTEEVLSVKKWWIILFLCNTLQVLSWILCVPFENVILSLVYYIIPDIKHTLYVDRISATVKPHSLWKETNGTDWRWSLCKGGMGRGPVRLMRQIIYLSCFIFAGQLYFLLATSSPNRFWNRELCCSLELW